MARFDTSFDETWDDDCAGSKGQPVGFPYTFPFFFDRDARFSDDLDESWGATMSKTGRYGVNSD